MDIKSVFLVISTLVGFCSSFIGIWAILKGKYKPQRTTRLIIVFTMTLFVFELIAQGSFVAIILAFTQWILCVSIFILSFKYGMGGNSKSDFIVLALALCAIIVWKTTNSPTLALYTSILADFLGVSPSLYKAYKHPFTEEPKFYASDTLAGFFSLLAIQNYTLHDSAFPAYVFFVNFVSMMTIIISRKMKQVNKQSVRSRQLAV